MNPTATTPALPPRRPITDTVVAPHRLSMGLAALPADECWLELDADLAVDLETKRALLDEHRSQVFLELTESRPAQQEVLEWVVETLIRHHPEHYERAGDQLRIVASGDTLDVSKPKSKSKPNRAPLETASLCVQEDLVVMEERSDGWCLTAGSVCFPTRWDLPSMLGRPMTAIHEPIPGYRKALDSSANRFFDRLKPGTIYRRGNWTLIDTPVLFQPAGHNSPDANPDIDASNAGEKIWLRAEHQTLQRLPHSDAVLFAIRVHRTRLDEAARQPEAARVLIDAIETMHPAMQVYKSLGRVSGAAKSYLRGRASSEG